MQFLRLYAVLWIRSRKDPNANFYNGKNLNFKKNFQILVGSGSCSDLAPDPDEHANKDPDPDKVGSDPRHWIVVSLIFPLTETL